MLVEAIMHRSIVHEVAAAAAVAVVIRVETMIRDGHRIIISRAAEVGHRVAHVQPRLAIMGMMMEEVSNKIHIKLSCTSQSPQIRTHQFEC